MSKRKAPADAGSTAAGKQKVQDDADFDEAALESLIGGAEEGIEGSEAGDLADQLDAGADQLADALDADGGDDDLLASAFAGDGDGDEEDDDEGEEEDDDDEPQNFGEHLPEQPPAAPFTAEVGELPESLSEESLSEGDTVDLSTVELTLEQARKVAQLLAANGDLSTVKMPGHALAVGDLREDDELEWDSEDYTDVDAIIISELMKSNTSVNRLDLARNNIGDAGAYALARMLEVNTTLNYLNLESCPFGDVGGEAFVGALRANTAVQYLNLKESVMTPTVQDALKAQWGSRGIGLHL